MLWFRHIPMNPTGRFCLGSDPLIKTMTLRYLVCLVASGWPRPGAGGLITSDSIYTPLQSWKQIISAKKSIIFQTVSPWSMLETFKGLLKKGGRLVDTWAFFSTPYKFLWLKSAYHICKQSTCLMAFMLGMRATLKPINILQWAKHLLDG